MTTICVTGGRHRAPTPLEMAEFWEIWTGLGATRLVHGDCRGTDTTVAGWVRMRSVREAAGWVVDAYGVKPGDGPWPGAGHRRNRRMLEAEQDRIALVVAFPGGTGTQSCVNIANELEIPVYRIEEQP